MIVTCKACKKRYIIDSNKIGNKGRKVRCINCGNVWDQLANNEEKDLAFYKVSDFIKNNKNVNNKKFKILNFLSIAAIISIFIGIILKRDEIIKLFPVLKPAYEKIGFSMEAKGVGLSFEQVSLTSLNKNGKKILMLKGEIVNNSNKIKYIPPIYIKIIGKPEHAGIFYKLIEFFTSIFGKEKKDLCVIDKWKHKLSANRLFPNERILFEIQPRNSFKNAINIKLNF